MIQDNESAINTLRIQHLLEEHEIIYRNFPAWLGHLMNPADNRFHSDYDRGFNYRLDQLNNLEQLSSTAQVQAAVEAYHAVPSESIHHYFRDLGLVPDSLGIYEPPAQVMSRLLSEGLRPQLRNVELHKKQLRLYLEDRMDRGVLIPRPPQRQLIQEFALWEVYDELLARQDERYKDFSAYAELVTSTACNKLDYCADSDI